MFFSCEYIPHVELTKIRGSNKSVKKEGVKYSAEMQPRKFRLQTLFKTLDASELIQRIKVNSVELKKLDHSAD